MDLYAPSLPPRQASSTAAGSDAVISTPVIEGPRWYRSRIRLLGPCAALLVPGAAGAIAVLSLRLFDTAWSGAVGLIAGVFAAPCLLAAGAPFGHKDLYGAAILASAVMWVLVGVLASRRATRNPMASWADFWRHYAWLCGGIWVGCSAALVVAAMTVGESLF